MACSGGSESIKLTMHCDSISNCRNGRSQPHKSIKSHSALHIDLQDQMKLTILRCMFGKHSTVLNTNVH